MSHRPGSRAILDQRKVSILNSRLANITDGGRVGASRSPAGRRDPVDNGSYLSECATRETQQAISEKLGCDQSLVSQAKQSVNSELDIVETTINVNNGSGGTVGENNPDQTETVVEIESNSGPSRAVGGAEKSDHRAGRDAVRKRSRVGDLKKSEKGVARVGGSRNSEKVGRAWGVRKVGGRALIPQIEGRVVRRIRWIQPFDAVTRRFTVFTVLPPSRALAG